MGIIERIKEIEVEMAQTQKNKATEYHLGQLRAKIAKLKTQLLETPKEIRRCFSVSKSNFPPYGRDFKGGKPTGRFSNGRVPSDLIAEGFGVKKSLPAYLDPNLQLEDLLTGICFASSSSVYDPLTAKLMNVLLLPCQLDLFKEYKSKIDAAVGNERTATILSKSVFLLSMGVNDLQNNYFATPLRNSHYDIQAYTDLLLESASNFLQELYALGARVIGVINMLPIGCVPSQRTLHGGKERVCYEAENQAAILFNSKLSPLIDSLNKSLPEAQLIYLDIYNSLLSMIQNPAEYGVTLKERSPDGVGTLVDVGLSKEYLVAARKQECISSGA